MWIERVPEDGIHVRVLRKKNWIDLPYVVRIHKTDPLIKSPEYPWDRRFGSELHEWFSENGMETIPDNFQGQYIVIYLAEMDAVRFRLRFDCKDGNPIE